MCNGRKTTISISCKYLNKNLVWSRNFISFILNKFHIIGFQRTWHSERNKTPFVFQGQITLMDVPVFKAIQPDVSSSKKIPCEYRERLAMLS